MDQISRFLFTELDIRGQHLQLTESWQQMLRDRHYPPTLARLLGELTAVTVMLANGLKHEGKVTLQMQGSGPVSLLVVEVDHQLRLRGMARTRDALPDMLQSMDELLGDGQLVLTLYNAATDRHVQSIVPRQGDSVAASFEHFFAQSEQLDTRLFLAANEQAIGGLLLQKMPEADSQDPDGWNRVIALAETVRPEELLSLPCDTLLQRLFHEETVQRYEPRRVEYHCPADRERVLATLKAMGEDEVRRILDEEGAVVIHNELCNAHFKFTREDIDALFGGQTH
ncbi:Hsp33 family molecular chaperone HslO [Sulfurivirga sp.]|uniref:Hsp33 family molecular chaperone HslO n=1 Tax=Sulfurivirga sp. TaxID=2614236 RepID=UPI0025D36116|nr:Hsp33 family molecular chaperone HslO [Sulfurivirga sp.]